MHPKKNFVQDIKAGSQISDVFMVVQCRQAQAKNGPYWQLTLQDKSGEIQARIWSPLSARFAEISPEQAVLVKAGAQLFGEQIQLNIEAMEFIDPENIDLSLFLPVSCISPEELHLNLLEFLQQNIDYPPWKKLARKILTQKEIKSALLTAPAAKSIHHAYMGGLLEHTLSVCRICNEICGIYTDLDRDILLTAAALHDLGKIREISHGLSREYSDEGKLLGHIFLGLEMIEPFLSRASGLDSGLVLHLKHIITSHHGELEFGSPKRPKTGESFVLHFADNLDAKLNTLEQALGSRRNAEGEASGVWSEYLRSLGRYVYQPPRTPRSPSTGFTTGKKEEQCLLPLKE